MDPTQKIPPKGETDKAKKREEAKKNFVLITTWETHQMYANMIIQNLFVCSRSINIRNANGRNLNVLSSICLKMSNGRLTDSQTIANARRIIDGRMSKSKQNLEYIDVYF